MRYAELFAGAGGLSMGLEAAGFHCAAHAEIEPHARAVLRYRWPDTRLDGDVTKLNGADYSGITLLSGGSPCQDLSVAGKRAGLSGSRSSLFHEQVRIWHESQAPYFLWENVYGAISSNAGRDFATVLSAIVGATVTIPVVGRGKSARGKWQRAGVASGPTAVAAWRVLDLQHFGPPQRRVRIFVLAARTGGVDPAEVLALGEGVCGHPSPRQQARQGAAGRAAGGVGACGVVPIGEATARQGKAHGSSAMIGAPGDPMFTLTSKQHGVAFGIDGEKNVYEEGMGTLNTGSKSGSGQQPVVLTFAERGRADGRSVEVRHDGVVNALMTPNGGRSGTGAGDGVLAFGWQNSAAQGDSVGDVSPSLDKSKTPAVMALDGSDTVGSLLARADSSPCVDRGQPAVIVGNSGMESWRERDTTITLAARDAKGPNNVVVGALDFGGHGGSYNGQDAYQGRIRAEAGRPRRLMPIECERLMSWPDDWTKYGRKEDGTVYELSDTARYRLCGNGVGSVCVEWIARRLADAIHPHPRSAAA